MVKPFPHLPHIAIAILSLVCGLLLWDNLVLRFAQIEEVLPTLDRASLYQGKEAFLGLIFLALILDVLSLLHLPWKGILGGGCKVRLLITCILFGITFIPLFWLRFGAAAWALTLLSWVCFLLNAAGLLILWIWLAQRLPLSREKQPLPRDWDRLHPWLPALLLFIASVYFAHRCFGLIPHIEDSIAQLLQARIYASGHVTTDPFTPREFFYFGFMVDSQSWFSQYPPGHPLLLALGVLAGTPWLVNPLLGVTAVVLFYFLLKEFKSSPSTPPLLREGNKLSLSPQTPPLSRGGNKGEKFAAWGAWAMALSPFVIFMSSEFMNHSTVLAASLAGWLALKKGESGKPLWLLLAGLAFGYCTSTRPLDGVVFGVVGGVLLVLSGSGTTPTTAARTTLTSLQRIAGKWWKIALYTLGFAIGILPYFIQNLLTTGHPLVTGYTLTWGGNGFGFGAVNWGPPHTLGYGLVNTFMSLIGLNIYLWEIPVPALLGVFLWGLLGGRLKAWDKAFLAVTILIPIGYLFYYFHDYIYGPRYYYTLVPQLIYFSVKGIRALYLRFAVSLQWDARVVQRALALAAISLLLLQFFVAVPRRAAIYADAYWGTDDGPRREAERLGLSQAIVFIENHPWEIMQTKLHSLGLKMGDAHRLLFVATPAGLDTVLAQMGYSGKAQWGAPVDPGELQRKLYQWNDQYLATGIPSVDPWSEGGRYTYYSNGAVHLDPRDRSPNIILARDLGEHNHHLLKKFPDRKAYRYAWDGQMGRFLLLPYSAPWTHADFSP